MCVQSVRRGFNDKDSCHDSFTGVASGRCRQQHELQARHCVSDDDLREHGEGPAVSSSTDEDRHVCRAGQRRIVCQSRQWRRQRRTWTFFLRQTHLKIQPKVCPVSRHPFSLLFSVSEPRDIHYKLCCMAIMIIIIVLLFLW